MEKKKIVCLGVMHECQINVIGSCIINLALKQLTVLWRKKKGKRKKAKSPRWKSLKCDMHEWELTVGAIHCYWHQVSLIQQLTHSFWNHFASYNRKFLYRVSFRAQVLYMILLSHLLLFLPAKKLPEGPADT